VAGRFEGRNPNAWFDTAGYLSHYTDVAAAGVNPLQHYETVGWTEGRDPSAGFDTLGYLTANPDVAAAHINPLDHFLNNGIYEGRSAINDGLFH
jgi:serralysin